MRMNRGSMGRSELIGNELIAGRGSMGRSELIGAIKNMSPAEREQVKEAIYGRRGALIKEHEYEDLTRLYLPFPVTNIGAGATGTVTLQPQDLYRTKRIMVPSTIAGDFRLTDFKVGQQPQFAQDGNLPAQCVTEVAVNGDVDFDSADVGTTITIRPENTSAAALDFEGTLIGLAAR